MLPQAADKTSFLPGQVAVLEMAGRNPSYVAFASAPEDEEYEFLVKYSGYEASIAYALFPLVRTVPLIAAIAFLLGLGLGASQPSLMSLIQHATPAGRLGEALGVRTTVMNMSHTLLPLLFGGVGTALGMGPVFWAMAVSLGATGVFARRHRAGP